MTAISGMMGRRALRTTLAVGAVSLGLAGLTACERPTPNAHFTLGASTSSPETASDCFGHDDPLGVQRAQECLEHTDDAPSFTSRRGETFRVGVDPSIAEHGWLLFVNGETRSVDPYTTTFQNFPVDELHAMSQADPFGEEDEDEGITVSVVKLTGDYDSDELMAAYQAQDEDAFNEALYGRFEGVWNARLEPGN
ncbi:hypothetical protein FNQ90_17480 [Streptomyces alkaliphilus]|uniref:DUF2771 domain-containing protein n=1 Tax=Streptomyces alkaliphilus TaxID=1472722 RepID=A0A7W3TFG1_9ACTN|nr:hypothetical protein [Streptomyces alkaliphilus]MBB0245849.1 hypothetical protein [Streptomyces alkaliphilus]